MDWIKKNYDRFALILIAVALLISSIFLFLAAHGFSDRFAPVLAEPPHKKEVEGLKTAALVAAEASLETPAEWKAHNGSLFVSRKYVGKTDAVTKRDILVDPFEPGSAPLHPPVPNDWFLQNGLADRILDGDVLEQDPDKDGFTNLDEFVGQSNPLDPNQHPAYTTKLRLKQFVKKPARLKFEAYDDDDGTFQVNTVDVRQPSQFVKIGDEIKGTRYKVISFEKKSIMNERTGVESDVSTLTVENTETHLKLTITLRQLADSPDLYARLSYLWDNTELIVKKDQVFSLKPSDDQYKLIDINETEAVITNLKTGDQIKVPRLE